MSAADHSLVREKDAAAYQRGADEQCKGITSAVEGLLLIWKVPFSKVTSASECNSGLTLNAKHREACPKDYLKLPCMFTALLPMTHREMDGISAA